MQELYEVYRRTDQPGVFYPSSLLILSLSIRLLRIKEYSSRKNISNHPSK